MSLSKVGIIGLGVVAGTLKYYLNNILVGAGIYYLSKDTTESKFDPKIHTDELLHKIVDDLYMEYACAYVFYYNMILNLKE
jgi:ATP/ADP translocase